MTPILPWGSLGWDSLPQLYIWGSGVPGAGEARMQGAPQQGPPPFGAVPSPPGQSPLVSPSPPSPASGGLGFLWPRQPQPSSCFPLPRGFSPPCTRQTSLAAPCPTCVCPGSAGVSWELCDSHLRCGAGRGLDPGVWLQIRRCPEPGGKSPPLPASPAVCRSWIAAFSPGWRDSELWRLQKLGLDPVLERYSHSLKGIKPDILENPKDQPP